MKRVLASILMASHLVGCTSWRLQSVTPQQVISERHPERLRVTRADNTTVVLSNPQLERESLVGSTAAGRTAVPLADVKQVEMQQTNGGKTALLVVGIAGLVALVVVLAGGGGGAY